ncbi:unnamed protein product [Microthlaspi erraticum]|uniref:F-box domain-containing protein n=1 Tax=Microthlaspi erraticum TaxID=1685480 RepID=A0A6D2J2U6_9BRAS|nr:unnamed protein product [Microthlaspi erraticum]
MEEHLPQQCTTPAGAPNPSPLFGGVDLISSLPDEILHHIFSFVPTKLAITTSVLSKRWRHLWCETPYLSFPTSKDYIESILKTLASHSAAKIMRFHLYVNRETCVASQSNDHVDSLIKFALSHNVEELSLVFAPYYTFPDVHNNFFLGKSWTSLRKLSLWRSICSDESFAKILIGSPMLESLTLQSCTLRCIDLSESLRLRRLDIERASFAPHEFHIVAPHIHYLRLIDFRTKCVLSDVPSLTEANVDTAYYLPRFWCIQLDPSKDEDYQVMMQTIEKLQNVENLTVGLSFLQMLSIAEFRGVSFPIFKVKTLTLKTTILRSAILGIAKLLQNSPGLKKITFYKTEDWNSAVEKYVNKYVNPQDPQHLIFPAGSVFEVARPDLVASFIELLLANTRTLETLVVHLGSYLNRPGFEELSQIALTLSHKNKVSIVLK